MAEKLYRQMIRAVSLQNIYDPEAFLFTNDMVEDQVSSFLETGEWKLAAPPEFLGFEDYRDQRNVVIRMMYTFVKNGATSEPVVASAPKVRRGRPPKEKPEEEPEEEPEKAVA